MDLQGSGDHLPLLRAQHPLHRDEFLQLLGGQLLAGALRLAPEDPDQDVGGPAQQPHHRFGDRGEPVQQRRHQKSPALRMLHRQPLGNQFADDDVDRRQHQGHRGDRDGLGGAAEKTQRGHQWFGEGDRRRRRGQEGGQGDAELDGAQVAVGVAGQTHQGAFAPAAAAFECPQLALPQRHQGDLTAREQAVEQEQDGDETNVEQVAIHSSATTISGRHGRATDRVGHPVLKTRSAPEVPMELMTGFGLASAAGLNAYIPLLSMGLLDRYTSLVNLPQGWAWLANGWVMAIIAVLLMIEIVADKVPALDSVNDAVQTFVRPASGGIVFGSGTAAQTAAVADPAEFARSGQWVPVAIGVVTALVVHLTKTAVRPAANVATAGVAAPVLSTIEDATSVGLTFIAILIPALVAVVLIALVWAAVWLLRRRRGRRVGELR